MTLDISFVLNIKDKYYLLLNYFLCTMFFHICLLLVFYCSLLGIKSKHKDVP